MHECAEAWLSKLSRLDFACCSRQSKRSAFTVTIDIKRQGKPSVFTETKPPLYSVVQHADAFLRQCVNVEATKLPAR